MYQRSLFIAASALALCLSVPAFAHHGWGGNVDQVSDMTGTGVKGVSLAGPHATMRINAEGHDWGITLAPPYRTPESGLKEGAIPVRRTVPAPGNRHRDANPYEKKTRQ